MSNGDVVDLPEIVVEPPVAPEAADTAGAVELPEIIVVPPVEEATFAERLGIFGTPTPTGGINLGIGSAGQFGGTRPPAFQQGAGFDPFKGVPLQTYRYRAHVKIIIDGSIDVTDRLEPHLVSVRVKDESPLMAEIELDDRDARLPIPNLGAQVYIEIGWVTENLKRVFSGNITKIEHAFGRKMGGRRMFIQAEGNDWLSDIKTPQQQNLGDGADPGKQEGTKKHSLQDFLQQVVGGAKGSALVISAEFGNIMRDHWEQGNASAVQQFTSMAQEFGAMSRVDSGDRFLFLKAGVGNMLSPMAEGASNVIAKWGDNLISWRIEPQTSRGTWKGMNQQYFDTQKAKWLSTLTGFAGGAGLGAGGGGGAGRATFALPAPAPNANVAEQQGQGGKEQSLSQGHGTLVMNGEPTAQWNGFVRIIGARDGVDGTYLILGAEHYYSRQGYITTLKVEWRGG